MRVSRLVCVSAKVTSTTFRVHTLALNDSPAVMVATLLQFKAHSFKRCVLLHCGDAIGRNKVWQAGGLGPENRIILVAACLLI